MRDIRGRRAQVVAAAAVAAMLLVGAAGCGSSSSSDGAKGSDGGTKTTAADGGGSSDDGSGDSGSGGGDLPNPCDLVPIEKASEILGGESAEPDDTTSELGTTAKACSWQTQASVDNPTLDGAGHILMLQAISAPETMSMEELWKTSKAAGDEDADIDGCDEAFWLGGMLSAYKDGVYLTGTAGLADDSPAAKESVTDLVSTACSNL